MKFDLTEEKEPVVMKSVEFQTETLPQPRTTFPILDLDVARQHFSKYLDQIEKMLKEAESLTVESEPANEIATFLGTSAKQIYKKIEDERQFYIGEPNAYVKSVNAVVKMFTEKLEKVETLMKAKIASYRAIQEQKRREQELAQRKVADELQKILNLEAKEKGIEPVKVVAPVLPKEPPVTRTETGSSHGRKIWTFHIPEPNYFRQLIADLEIQWEKMKASDSDENRQAIGDSIAKVREIAPYLVISDKSVRDAIKGGVREIPGIKIFQDDRTTFRT